MNTVMCQNKIPHECTQVHMQITFIRFQVKILQKAALSLNKDFVNTKR